jgi:hypothetical protein
MLPEWVLAHHEWNYRYRSSRHLMKNAEIVTENEGALAALVLHSMGCGANLTLQSQTATLLGGSESNLPRPLLAKEGSLAASSPLDKGGLRGVCHHLWLAVLCSTS